MATRRSPSVAQSASTSTANAAKPPLPRSLLATPDVFAVTLQLLYSADVLSGDGIAAWGAQPDFGAPLRESPQITQLLEFFDDDDSDGSTEDESD